MSLNKEQYEQLPDFAKSEYVEVNGEYKHGGLVKVKQTADELNGKLETERREREQLSKRLEEIEASQAQKIEEARKQALEQARNKGDVAEIEKRYQEQMADLEKRTAERVRNETLAEISSQRASEKAQELARKIAVQKAVDEDAGDALFELLQKRVTFDKDTGKPVFLNDDGSASSLDEKGFIAEVEKSKRYKHLIKASVTTKGGGLLNGSQDGSGAPVKTASRSDFETWTQSQRAAFFKSGGKLTD